MPHRAVWSRSLVAETEGPSLIFNIARKSSSFVMTHERSGEYPVRLNRLVQVSRCVADYLPLITIAWLHNSWYLLACLRATHRQAGSQVGIFSPTRWKEERKIPWAI